MKTLIITASLLIPISFAKAEEIGLAKVAELACHRVERLVTLKKIDESFLHNQFSIQPSVLNASAPTDPAFKAVVSQVPGADSTGNQVVIYFDGAGKALRFELVPGASPVNAPVWPDKDPVTLSENSLHYILDGWQTISELKPFYTGLTQMKIEQVKDAQGQIFSRAELRSSEVPQKLEILLKADGNFVSAKIIP
jgi:hypothetical protein